MNSQRLKSVQCVEDSGIQYQHSNVMIVMVKKLLNFQQFLRKFQERKLIMKSHANLVKEPAMNYKNVCFVRVRDMKG